VRRIHVCLLLDGISTRTIGVQIEHHENTLPNPKLYFIRPPHSQYRGSVCPRFLTIDGCRLTLRVMVSVVVVRAFPCCGICRLALTPSLRRFAHHADGGSTSRRALSLPPLIHRAAPILLAGIQTALPTLREDTCRDLPVPGLPSRIPSRDVSPLPLQSGEAHRF